jgi:hypothetical protein
MKHFAFVLLAISSTLLVGCDTMKGTFRTVTVSQLPSPTSVIAALNALPNVQRVRQDEVPISKGWNLKDGVFQRPGYAQFVFETGRSGGCVETREDSKGIKTLHLYTSWLNHTPPKAEFDEARALLDAAYVNLRRQNPNLPPPEAVKEELWGYPSK